MPKGIYLRPSTEERFWSKVEKTEGCWNWKAAKDRYGYGRFSLPGAGTSRAHVIAYKMKKPIPEGFDLGHLCQNRACVNPNHLEIIIHQICRECGVPLNVETNWNKSSSEIGSRICVSCNSIKNRGYHTLNRERQNAVSKEWYHNHKSQHSLLNSKYKRKLKITVLSHYGGMPPKCVKCGFDDIRALSIEHPNSDGANERKRLFGSSRSASLEFYSWLRKMNYPPGYTVLCMNCQFISYREFQERMMRQKS